MKKKIFGALAAILALGACQKYELNTEFSMPTELSCPSSVDIDVTSTQTILLSWQGGGAADGGLVLYEVLFDKQGGDFSEPIYCCKSDLGAGTQLSLSHATLNIIARKAGIAPNQSGTLIWTVKGAKGGVSKTFDGFQNLKITRGEGIDNIPEHLFINGTAALEAGQEFRNSEEGVFVIVTQIGAGKINFCSEKGGSGNLFYVDEAGKLNEGSESYNLNKAPESGLARITVNFNTLGYKLEEIGTQVRCVWGADKDQFTLATLEYQGDGTFVGDGDVTFLGPGREGNPSWCSWVEERYYFMAMVDGKELCWGSNLGGNAYTPDGSEEFYYMSEHEYSQWDNLWKMDHAFDNCHVTFTIYTNKDNHWTHSYVGGAIHYDQPTAAPGELYLSGNGAEQEGQAFRNAGNGKFVIYSKLNAGGVSFVDENGVKYFADAEGKLFIGSPKTSVEASSEVSRITVDFGAKTYQIESVSSQVDLVLAMQRETPAVTLTYQGLGKWAGEGDIKFIEAGWGKEERYYFYLTVNGSEACWGRLDGVDGEHRPDGAQAADYFHIGEFDRSDQWGHCWKLASELDGSHATVSINTNDEGAFTHSFVVAGEDPVPPTIAPNDLSISGTGAESDGAAFRKVADGVFQIFCKLSDGAINFKSGNKNFFADASGNLLQGRGETTSTASSEALCQRITVDFVNCKVSVENVDKVECFIAWTKNALASFVYSGNGIFSGEGHVKFLHPEDNYGGSWVEERYKYRVVYDGQEKCWGRVDGADGENRPDGEVAEIFWEFGEFDKSDWNNCWKFATALDDTDALFTLNTNDNGKMTRTITAK